MSEQPDHSRFIPGWGTQLDTSSLEQLYAPQEVRPYVVPPGGIDNLGLSSQDVFVMASDGREFRVDFDGYFQVARANPTSERWEDAEVYVNLTDMRLRGQDERLGRIEVRINPDVTSAGQTFAAGSPTGSAKCRIAVAVQFDAPDTGVTLFNKEPILLMNNAIESVPPVEDPNGAAHIYLLPLFRTDDPDGRPMAYLSQLHYTVGNYLEEERAQEIRSW
jgi:hypothetical protein